MSADPRAALERLVVSFERHLEASRVRHGDEDPRVIAAYEDLADAFEAYDGALYDAYGEMTPLDVYAGDEEDEEDRDDEDLDDEADVGPYSGLDDLDVDDDVEGGEDVEDADADEDDDRDDVRV